MKSIDEREATVVKIGERLLKDRKFLEEILQIRAATIDVIARAKPEANLDVVAYDLFPPAIRELKLNFEEVTNVFIWAATAKAISNNENNVILHPLELLSNPNTYEYWVRKGDAIAESKLPYNAIICYDKAIGIDSMRSDAFVGKGKALYDLAHATSGTVDVANKPIVASLISKLGGNTNRYEQAIQYFERALQFDSSSDASHYYIASCLIELGRPTNDWSKVLEAIPRLQRALEINPKNINAKKLLDTYLTALTRSSQ